MLKDLRDFAESKDTVDWILAAEVSVESVRHVFLLRTSVSRDGRQIFNHLAPLKHEKESLFSGQQGREQH